PEDRRSTAVAHAEALARATRDTPRADGRAVHNRLAGDDVFSPSEARFVGGANDDFAAAHALSNIVVSVTQQGKPHSICADLADALAGRTGEHHIDRASRQTGVSVTPCD